MVVRKAFFWKNAFFAKKTPKKTPLEKWKNAKKKNAKNAKQKNAFFENVRKKRQKKTQKINAFFDNVRKNTKKRQTKRHHEISIFRNIDEDALQMIQVDSWFFFEKKITGFPF